MKILNTCNNTIIKFFLSFLFVCVSNSPSLSIFVLHTFFFYHSVSTILERILTILCLCNIYSEMDVL
jgi:hypothetical protein